MDEQNTYTEPTPVEEPVSHARELALGILIFVLGVVVGGAAMWYRSRPQGVPPKSSLIKPKVSASPRPSASLSPTASASLSPLASASVSPIATVIP